MKVTPQDFTIIERALYDTLSANNLTPIAVQCESHLWDLFSRAWNEKRIDGNALYKNYNDAHLLTAMRKIFSLK